MTVEEALLKKILDAKDLGRLQSWAEKELESKKPQPVPENLEVTMTVDTGAKQD